MTEVERRTAGSTTTRPRGHIIVGPPGHRPGGRPCCAGSDFEWKILRTPGFSTAAISAVSCAA